MSEPTLKPFTGKLDDNTNSKQQPALKPFTGALDGEDKGFLGQAKDHAVSFLGKGTVGVGEVAVGLSDMMSDGATGKILSEKLGYDPKAAKNVMTGWQSEQYQQQLKDSANIGNRKIEEGDDFATKVGKKFDNAVDITKNAISNPSLITNTVAESLPSMFLGGVLGRASGIANPVVAGAVGEGAVMAGSQAEQIRQETVDGRLTADQSLASVGTGALGGLFGYAGGRLAQKMGLSDVDTAMQTGRLTTQQVGEEIAKTPMRAIPTAVIKGAISEGFLEELPQSVSEQILQNLALDKPWHDGVENAAVMGALAGMAMGGTVSGVGKTGDWWNSRSDTGSQDNQQQSGSPNLPSAPSQFGSNPDSALTGEYIPRGNVPQGDNQGRTAFVYDQPSMDADNLLNNNGFDNTATSDAPVNPNDPDTPPAPNGNYFDNDYGSDAAFDDLLNAVPPTGQTPSQQMGINPNDGPMSSAAALAVDSGASPVAQLGYTPTQQTQEQSDTPISDALPSDYRQLLESQNGEQPFNASFEDVGESTSQQYDANAADAMGGGIETDRAKTTTAQTVQPILGADGQNKWFGSQDKAQAFIDKKDLGNDYEVVQDGKRFEIQPKAKSPVQDDAYFQSQLDQLDKQRAQFESSGDYANAEKVYDEMQKLAREWQTNPSTATSTSKRAEPSKGASDSAWGDFYRKNRNMMNEELFMGGHQDRNALEEATPEIQSRHAHGMAKATPAAAVRDLKDILENGIDQNRGQGRLFTAPLSQGKLTAEQRSAMSASGTSSGSAYSDGAFTLIAKEGVGDIRSVSEIDAVMVNSAVPQEVVNGLRQDFPNMKFGYAKELPSLLSGGKQSNNAQAQVAELEQQLKNEKSVPKKAQIRKQITELQNGLVSDQSQGDVPNPYDENNLRANVRNLSLQASKEAQAQNADDSNYVADLGSTASARSNEKVKQQFPELYKRAEELAKTAEIRSAGRRGNTSFSNLSFKGDSSFVSGDSWTKRPTSDEILQQAIWHLSQDDKNSAPDDVPPNNELQNADIKNLADSTQETAPPNAAPNTEDLVSVTTNDGETHMVLASELNDSNVKNLTKFSAQGKRVAVKLPRGRIASTSEQSQQPKQAEQPKVEANEQRESKIQSWINEWSQLKENGTASELDNFHKKVKIALNGFAQKKGVVAEFEQLKVDIENFAKDYNKLPKTEQSTNTGPSAAETSTEQITAEIGSEATKTEATQKPKVEVSENKVVTEERRAELEKLIKAKLSQLNSGIDPELIVLGTELALYHIERGVRTFAAYAKAMTESLGDNAKPFLKSWYMGVKYDPRATGFDGMSSAAEVENFDLDDLDLELGKKKETVVMPSGRESDDEASRNKSDLQEDEVTNVEPSQKLKEMMERSKQRVHSSKQIIVDEHNFLNIGSSILTGQPVYTLWNDRGNYFTVDVDSIKPNATFNQVVIDKARAVKKQEEQRDAELVKKYPNGVFSGTDTQVVTTENVPKKVKEYLGSLLNMLGMDTKVFLATSQDINAQGAQEKYHIYGGHRSILSTQVNAEENGATRLISINQSDFNDAYIALNSGMSEETMIEVIAHELGHLIEKTLLKNASKETLDAIKADFQQWLGSVKGVSKREHLALMRNRHIAQMNMQDKASIMDTSNANLSPYWFSFSEWFADQVSRWTTTSEKPLSLVEKFFASVAKKLKQLAQIVKNTKESYQPSVSVRDYLDGIARADFLEELYPQQSDGEVNQTKSHLQEDEVTNVEPSQKLKEITDELGDSVAYEPSSKTVEQQPIIHTEGKKKEIATTDVVKDSFDKAKTKQTKAEYDAMLKGFVADIEAAIKVAPDKPFSIDVPIVWKARTTSDGSPTIENYIAAKDLMTLDNLDDVIDSIEKTIKGNSASYLQERATSVISDAVKEYQTNYGNAPLRIVFDVKGDGRFNVRNDKQTLENFLKKVKNNSGFKPPVKSMGGRETFNRVNAIRDMLKDSGDQYRTLNAYEMAKSMGYPIVYGDYGDYGIIAMVVLDTFDYADHTFHTAVQLNALEGGKKENIGAFSVVTEQGISIAPATTQKEAKASLTKAVKPNEGDKIDRALRSHRSVRNMAEFRPQSELQQQFEAKLYASQGLELPENQEDTANEQTTTSITASTSGQSRQNRSANAANAMADNAENEAVSTQSSADLPSTNEQSNGSRQSGSTRTSTSRKNKPSTGSATGTGAATASSTKRSDKPITAASGKLDEKIADDLATKVEQANPDITDFVITDNSTIGKGSLEQKFNDNIAAIQTVHKLDAENRLATPEERQIIARYIGWGGLSNAFDENAKGWEAKAKLLKSLLSEDDYKNAINTVNSAFFTPTTVTRSMWDMVEKLGFKGGLVLEPSVGVGNFLGVSPKGMENKFIGVEYDGITSRIAQHLYPSSTIIHSGYEAMPLADNMFDLVIANPPYGSKKEIFKTKPHLNKFSIHNQFIIGNIENLKPNGIAVIVVTHSFMDAADNSARKLVASMSNLVAAVRLPENTFKENANTSVITDILIFQKFDEATKAQFDEAKIKLFPDWVNSGTLESEDGQPMSFSRYFTKGKGKVIGKVVNTTNQFGGSTFTVKHDGNLKADLAQFVSELPLLIEPNTAKSIAQKAEIDFNNATSHMILGSSNVEVGSVGRNSKGELTHVIERENEFGGLSLVEEIITPDTVWSKSYSIDANGNYFKLVAALDEKGKPQKVLNKAGKPTNFNVYVRQIVPVDKISTSSKLGERKYKALQALVSMRDLLKEQIWLERYGLEGMERNRKLLAKAYHDFVKPQKEGGYGFINAPYAAAIVNELPDAALLFSLEKSYKKEVKVVTGKDKVGKNIIAVAKPAKATPADILSKQVLNVVSDITRADTIEDALAVSLSQTGKVDIDLIASLLESNADAVIKQLRDSRDNPLAFFDPSLNSWVPREKYLAGNVRQKLNAASNTNLEKNIESLERVLPKTIPIENISLALGMEWIPESVYTKFASYITGDQNTTVKFNHVLKEYAVEAAPTQEKALLFGTERMPPNSLLNHIMNSRSITIRDYVKHSDGSTSSTVNQAQTEAAVTMAETIKNEFLQWIYGQQDIVEQLANVFNHVYNSMVLGKFDGSHLKFVGKVPDEIIKLRKHQIDGIWRGVTNSFVLYDHAVGSGKTFTGIARAIERKRLGLSKKPLMVVPNHMVEQFAADVYRLYPGANVLAAGRKKFTGENRRKLFARIATGDYDLIIVPHSSFSFMSMSSEFEEQFIEKQVDQVVDALREAENSEEGKRGMTVKRLRDLYAKLTSRLEKKRNAIRKDRMITFEEMGIDDITVDEAHEFKNLFYNTNLKGIVGLGQTSGSNKAFDLFMKFQYLHQMGYSGAFMTGTPISNSAVEMHAMMRYLMPNELEQLGLESFDSWQKMFANNTAKFEATESGQLKLKSRFARDWKNMSVLMNSWYTVVDPVTNEDVKRVYKEIEGKDFPLPRVKGGSRQSVVVAPDQYQEMLLAEVLDGFAGLEDISDPKEKAAERFRLFDKAKKLSLDARSVNPIEYADAEGPKIKAVTASVFDLYKKWNKDKGTQIIFLDRSVPKSKGDEKQIKEYDELVNKMEQAERDGDDDLMLEISEKLDKYDSNEINEMRIAAQGGWTAYDEIKRQLIAKGIPADEIAFIHDANNDEEKQALFEKVKSGEVRVLIGNTPRMGAGTNVQDRLVGLHHVDVTWKPSDIEQREGRIIRQGNLLYEKYGHDNFEVVINAYVTERTMDAKLWDINSAKLKTINGIRNYNGEYEMDFGQDADAISMQEIAAIASGDPLMLERVELDAEIQALQREQQQHERRQSSFISQVSKANQQIQTLPTMIKALQDSQKRHDQTYEKVLEKFNSQEITIDGEKFDSRDSAELYVRTKYDSAKQKAGEGEKVSVTYKIDGQNFDSMTRANEYIKNGFAMRQPIEIEYNGQTFNDSTDMMSDMFAQNGDKLPSLFKSDRENAMTINGIPVDIDVDRDGFNFVMYAEDGTTEIQVLGSQYMHFKDATALRVANLINAIAKGLSKLDQKIAEYEQRLQSAKDVVKGVSDKIGQAFAKQDVLDAKKERLESVLSQLKAENSNDTKEDGPLYSRNTKGNSGSTVQQVRGVLIDRFGKDTIKELERQGKLEIIQDYSVEGVEGYYHNGKAVLVASNLTDQSVIPTFLHELGGHAGFQNMMKPEQYADLMRQFERMVKQGNRIALEAKKLAERERGFERQQLEYLPYLLTLASNMQIKHAIHKGSVTRLISDLISKVKAWIYDRLGVNINLNPNDMVALAERMIDKAQPKDVNTDKLLFSHHEENNKASPSKSEVMQKDSNIYKGIAFPIDGSEPKIVFHNSNQADAFEVIAGYKKYSVSEGMFDGVFAGPNAGMYGEYKHAFVLDEGKIMTHADFNNLDYSEYENAVKKLHPDWTDEQIETAWDYLSEDKNVYSENEDEWGELFGFDAAEASWTAQGLRGAVARLLGYQAVEHYDETGTSTQVLSGVKSVPLSNNETFDEAEQRIFDDWKAWKDLQENSTDSNLLYSRQSMQDTIDKLSQNLKQFSVKSVKDKTSYKWADWLGVGLQFLGRRQLTEIYAKLLPQLSKYNELAAQMDADKNDAAAKADSIVREWSKLKDDEALANVMHDSTLAKIDPTKPYVSGDSISKYKQLRNAYNSLSPEAQAMYVKARDAYKQHYAEVHQSIKERILRSELSNQKKADLLKQMDDNFFGQVKGVYFPLARFGKFVVVMRNQNGEVESVSRAETMGEAQALRSELMQKYPHYKVDRVTLDKEFNTSRDAVGRGFMSSLFAEVDNLGLSTSEQAEFEDTLSQLYLSSMPDLSWAKHGIHRKGTAGFSQDARRAFAQNMFSGANYLAKLRYGDQLAQQLDDMQKYASEQGKQDDSYDQPTAQRVIDEMNKRHDNLMNPKGHPLSSALTSMGFIYYLGLSPAAAMVNLSQTALVAYPIMGAKWGFDRAASELLKASNDFRKGVEFHKVKWQGTKTDLYKAVSADISKFLTKDEQAAYQKAVDSGVIDVTQAHDLAGIAQGEDSGIMWKTRPIMRAASVMFHSAERFNREVTFIAAYRLARQSGSNHDAAYAQAVDATYKGHFDYSSGNRPRIMQGNVAKVLLLFKQFGQNMLYTLARQTYQSIKGETAAQRKEARKSLGAILAMHATFAGALGLPMVGMLLLVASWMGGDDDEPWDAEVALRNYLAEAFNPTISNMLMKGAPRGIGVDISSRVGINNLLLPDTQEGLEGKKWWDSAASAALGPIGGIGANVAKGAQEISEGHNLRGVESMLPVFLKNFAKTYRYADEGVQDKTGVSIMDEVDSMDLLVQGMGFSPSDVRTANEGKAAIYQLDRKLSERRSRLMALWSRAKMMDDRQEMDEIWEEIKGFNEKNPSRRITKINLNQSYRNRQRRIDRAEDGIYLPRNHQDAREVGKFADTD